MKYKIEQLLNRGYESVARVGKIGIYTTAVDFLNKIEEELTETEEEFLDVNEYIETITDRQAEEITDIIQTCCNMLIHYKRNPIEEIEKVVIKNEKRAK